MNYWVWRGIFVATALFLAFALYRLSAQIPAMLFGNVTHSDVIQLEVKLLDATEGYVTARSSLQLFGGLGTEIFADSSVYPLSMEFCLLASLDGLELSSLKCFDRQFSSSADLQPVITYDQSFYLPNAQLKYVFQSIFDIRSKDGKLLNSLKSSQERLVWTPKARVRLLSGLYPSPNEVIPPQEILFAESRFSDVIFTVDGSRVVPRLVVNPAPDMAFRFTDEGMILHQWAFPVPKTENDFQWCLQVNPAPADCYMVQTSGAVLPSATFCGNSVLDAGEECDDGNGHNDDACTDRCLLNLSFSEPVSFPFTNVSVQTLDDDQYSLFAKLVKYTPGISSQVDPRELFIRFSSDGLQTLVSQERIDGYPYLQVLLTRGQSGTLEFFRISHEQEYVFHTSTVDTRSGEAVIHDLKSAAGEIVSDIQESTVSSLQVKWLGSGQTLVDQDDQKAVDLGGNREFMSRVVVQSTFEEAVKVTVQLVDESISFSHTLAPMATEEIPISIPDFSYGDHRLVVFAVFPDGQKTADILLPFTYRAGTIVQSFGLAWWQGLAVAVLCLMGFSYLTFRILFLMRRDS